MKRLLLHILFWSLYTVQDALLIYTWVGPALGKISEGRLIQVSLLSAVVMLLPKLLIVYFILHVSIKKFLNEKEKPYRIIIEATLVLILAIIFYRLLNNYYINPYLYYSAAFKDSSLFDIRRILLALMDIGFVTGIALVIKFVQIQVTVKEKEKSLLKEKLETELKFLRNQTNPHFLMNTLNNIYALARKKSEDTAEVVMKLSELLRFILYESNGRLIALTDEIKVLEDYLELEMIRYNDRLSVSFTKEMDTGSYQITPLLLLPLVENAFKHGISETRFESFIHIDVKAKEGILFFNIENTKENTNADVPKNNIGLNNVRRQLELIYKDYKFNVTNEGAVFKVYLTINLNSHFEI